MCRGDEQRRAAAVEVGAEDRLGVCVAELLGDQLEPGGVRHRRCPRAEDVDPRARPESRLVRPAPPRCRPRRSARASPRGAWPWILLAQPQDPVHERLGPRRAAGHVHVDRHELVRRDERVVVEHAHRRAAGAHRDRPLGLEHLVVDAADDRRHLDRHPAGEDEQVGLARRGAEGLEAEAGDVQARADDRHHLDRAAGEAERQRVDRVALRPGDRLLERGGQDALLDVALERLAVEVAAQHVARRELADAEVVSAAAAGRLALYFHSSAPRRQT